MKNLILGQTHGAMTAIVNQEIENMKNNSNNGTVAQIDHGLSVGLTIGDIENYESKNEMHQIGINLLHTLMQEMGIDKTPSIKQFEKGIKPTNGICIVGHKPIDSLELGPQALLHTSDIVNEINSLLTTTNGYDIGIQDSIGISDLTEYQFEILMRDLNNFFDLNNPKKAVEIKEKTDKLLGFIRQGICFPKESFRLDLSLSTPFNYEYNGGKYLIGFKLEKQRKKQRFDNPGIPNGYDLRPQANKKSKKKVKNR